MTSTSKSGTPFDKLSEEIASMDTILGSNESETSSQSDLSRGNLIEATIVDYDDTDVYMNIGGKQDGRCSRSEFKEEPQKNRTVFVIVEQSSEEGMVRLSYAAALQRVSWAEIKEAFEQKTRLTGKVKKEAKTGYIIEYNGLDLFLPRSHAHVRGGEHLKMEAGTEIDFKILEIREKPRPTAVVSHRLIVEEINEKHWSEFVEKYKESDVVEAEVTKKVSFGVFLNVDGIEGLLHQSDISWKKFAPFKDRFKVGDRIQVKILKLDREGHRLSLGLKQLQEDPWEWVRSNLTVGGTVQGKVTNITDYGAFLEIREGLEGLIHVSELTWSKRVKHPKKYLVAGQDVEAIILAIDYDEKRIGLGIRQLQEDPWGSLTDSVRVGDILEGNITSITKFGAFVKVKDDVEGLIHFKDYSWDDNTDKKMLKKGDHVQYRILDINIPDRRISCGIKQLTPSPYEALKNRYRKNDIIDGKVTGITPFGIFVDIGDGLEGLVHVSRISLAEGEKLEELYKVGDEIKTVLLRVDVAEKRISLSIKAYEQQKEREIISKYIRRDDAPSTSSMGAFFKKEDQKP